MSQSLVLAESISPFMLPETSRQRTTSISLTVSAGAGAATRVLGPGKAARPPSARTKAVARMDRIMSLTPVLNNTAYGSDVGGSFPKSGPGWLATLLRRVANQPGLPFGNTALSRKRKG